MDDERTSLGRGQESMPVTGEGDGRDGDASSANLKGLTGRERGGESLGGERKTDIGREVSRTCWIEPRCSILYTTKEQMDVSI